MSKNYLGVEDLLCNDIFLSWYFRKDPRAIKQWKLWLDANPGNGERVEQAIEFLNTLMLEEKEIPAEQITYAESLLLNKIREAENNTEAPTAPVLSITKRRWWMAAASILVFAAGLGGGYWWLSYTPELHTDYGEIRERKLPDGSEVVVNADSKVVFSSAGWKEGKDREVWLNGEAFFHVSKTPQKSRFIVHTNHFDIIVLGTQFDVVDRPGKASVMLKEGSVILHTSGGQDLKMIPGDFVEYHPAGLEKRPVKNDSILAWKDHKLIFDNTPLREVARIIKEHYGVSVQLADDSVAAMTISGILPNDNLDVLLQALDATLDFEVEHVVHEGGMITISRKHP
jgi:transmembrane sensor